MVFLRTLSGQTAVLSGSPASTVAEIKATIERLEGIAAEDQRILFGGKQLDDDDLTLADFGVEELSTLDFELRLLGGGKKRKKKVYSTPKKPKHKRKKVKLAVLKYYKISDDGNIERQRVECTNATCGGGVFMAKHQDRHYCGKCHATLIENK
uniref:Ubiquitin-like domain-containing protein n=1 Tax=Panagrolaimus sp. ES5 TaxID=591445 RepID=A0AC34FGD5_9BILA